MARLNLTAKQGGAAIIDTSAAVQVDNHSIQELQQEIRDDNLPSLVQRRGRHFTDILPQPHPPLLSNLEPGL